MEYSGGFSGVYMVGLCSEQVDWWLAENNVSCSLSKSSAGLGAYQKRQERS